MRKDLKKKMLEHGYSLYQTKWVEETATDGFKKVMANLREREPEFAAIMEKCLWPFEVMYYTAFEDALNTFILKCLEDDATKIELAMDEFGNIAAELETKLNDIETELNEMPDMPV